MMRVRILAGFTNEPFTAGDILDLPDDRAQQLLREERAELLRPQVKPPRKRTE